MAKNIKGQSSGIMLSDSFPHLAKEAHGWNPNELNDNSSKKMNWVCSRNHVYEARVTHRTQKKTGCPFCSNHKLLKGFNDFRTINPELASEAYGWDPSETICFNNKPAQWKCKIGHIYQARVGDRRKKDGCPFCSNRRLLVGFNDLRTTHPELAEEAHGWNPEDFVAGSNKRLEWKCNKGHLWKAQPNGRLSGSGCPFCANLFISVGFNDLETTHPEVAQMAKGWDPKTIVAGNDKIRNWTCPSNHVFKARATDLVNGKTCGVCANKQVLEGFNDLKSKFPEIANEADGWDPKGVVYGSNKILAFKCKYGHKWKTTLVNRTYRGDGCPSCAEHGFNPDKDGWLYFLTHEVWNMQQIGITNDPKVRIRRHEKLGWTVLEIRGPMKGALTRSWEQSILKALKKIGVQVGIETVNGKFDGYTECWEINSYQALNLKELMNLVHEVE